MIEKQLDQTALIEQVTQGGIFKKVYIVFILIYVFLSGFVFVEPSFAEIMILNIYSFSGQFFEQIVNPLFMDSLHWRHLWILLVLSFM